MHGPGDYRVIGNSLSLSDNRDDCWLKNFSTAFLDLPTAAHVVKAILYWSASGPLPDSATAEINGAVVTANKTYATRSGQVDFHGAEVDVTKDVFMSASYTFGKITALTDAYVCNKGTAYEAWTIVVVYEKDELPNSQINVCTDNFQFTFS